MLQTRWCVWSQFLFQFTTAPERYMFLFQLLCHSSREPHVSSRQGGVLGARLHHCATPKEDLAAPRSHMLAPEKVVCLEPWIKPYFTIYLLQRWSPQLQRATCWLQTRWCAWSQTSPLCYSRCGAHSSKEPHVGSIQGDVPGARLHHLITPKEEPTAPKSHMLAPEKVVCLEPWIEPDFTI
jgi:hypothetical protein